MKIMVLNGSPKGDMSITLQYAKFVANHLKEHEFIFENIGKIVENSQEMERFLGEVAACDGIIWCQPVYTMLVPYQVKRFIELVEKNKKTASFEGKYATAISTSVHFYDHTAHNYLQGISEDWGMKYISGYSADMSDIALPENRKSLLCFAVGFIRKIEKRVPVEKRYVSLCRGVPKYDPGIVEDTPKEGKRKIVLLVQDIAVDCNLKRMVETFVKVCPNPVEVYNIDNINIKGGCLGCIRCGYDGTCVYKDDLVEFYKKNLMDADIIIYAGKIVDRYLSSRWKMFIDRGFFNGHRPVLMGKQIGFIVSGRLKNLENLQEICQADAQVSYCNLAGIVTDECEDSAKITALLKNLADEAIWAHDNNYIAPFTYLQVGAHKIFRDMIYELSFIFKEDLRFYKEHGLFKFPQDDLKGRVRNGIMSLLMKIPSFKKSVYEEAVKRMLEDIAQYVD